MNNKITIPRERHNLPDDAFYRQLEQRKETKKQEWYELYGELKYKVVVFACTWGIGIAIFFWLLSAIFNFPEIKKGAEFYLSTIATLYVGSLIGKEF